MNRETIGGLAAVCLAVGIYLCWAKPGAPPSKRPVEVPATVAAPETTPPTPSSPVVLAAVVDVTDLDPLLDPPSKSAPGVPFDEEMSVSPVNAPPAPERIPPAAEFPDLEAAPMPREVMAVPQLHPACAVWYGTHRLPRQIGGGLPYRELLTLILEHTSRFPNAALPPGFQEDAAVAGVGFFF